MNERLKDTVKLLEDKGMEFRVVDMGRPTQRAQDVLAADDSLGIDKDSIVKTIMFKSKKNGNFCISLRSSDRIDYKKVKKLMGDKHCSTLHPDRMRELGWEPGECSPLSVPGPLYIDEGVLKLDWIHSGSGDLSHGLEYNREIITQLRDDVQFVDIRQE